MAAGTGLETDFAARIERAAAPLRERGFEGAIGIVLGSGLGGFVNSTTILRACAHADIRGLVPPTVSGHGGRLLQLEHAGRRPLVLEGRPHAYEGWGSEELLLGVGLLHALGCRTLLLTNAAGGLRPDLQPGDLMVLCDMIDLHLRDPLRGLWHRGGREGAHAVPFDPELAREFISVAKSARIPLRRGVYASVWGPNYETSAEIRMLRRLGADAVGMSTAPEATFAHALGMRVAGLSCITNVARETGAAAVSHEEVVAVSHARREDFARLLLAWLEAR